MYNKVTRFSSNIIRQTEDGKEPVELITDSGEDLIVNPIGGYWRSNDKMVEWAKKYRASYKEYGAYTTIDNDYFLWNEGNETGAPVSLENWEIIQQYPLRLHINMHVHPLSSPQNNKLYEEYEKQKLFKWVAPDVQTFSSVDFWINVKYEYFEMICIDSKHYYVLQPPKIGWDAFKEKYAESDIIKLDDKQFEQSRNAFKWYYGKTLWDTYRWNLKKVWEETVHANILDLSKQYRIPYARYLNAEF